VFAYVCACWPRRVLVTVYENVSLPLQGKGLPSSLEAPLGIIPFRMALCKHKGIFRKSDIFLAAGI